MTWEGLSPPYGTIVADPPWEHGEGSPPGPWSSHPERRHLLPYESMTLGEIRHLGAGDLAAADAHLYLWTTNRFLRASFDVAESWGFRPAQMLTWCKPVQGVGPGGTFSTTTEFCLFARRGRTGVPERHPTSWWCWPRGPHSAKPAAFLDIVESVSPGPFVELFARAPRLGWDHWGHGYEIGAA